MRAPGARFPWAWLPWFAIAVVAIGTTSLLMLPASLMTDPVARATRDLVTLEDAEGTLWSGSASVIVGEHDGAAAPLQVPGRVYWTIDWAALLTGRISASARMDALLTQSLSIDGKPSDLEISAAAAALPAGVLARLGPPLSTLGIDGGVRLSWGRLRISHGLPIGDGEIRLVDARSSLSKVVPLGTYRIAFVLQGDSGNFTLYTDKGPLILGGAGHWSGAALSFRGQASAEAGDRDQLADLLGILGKRQGDSYLLSFGAL